MCKIALSTIAYESQELYLNTLILNQRDKSFTEQDIISAVEPEEIDPALVKITLQRLIHKGLIICSDGKFYVRPIVRKSMVKTF